MTIQIFIAGGTFDKEYDEIKQQLVFTQSHVPEVLSRGRCGLEIQLETLMLVDSLHMEASHRQQILSACQACVHQKIVVTHGTDTMPLTAKTLGEAKLNKTIILTGAMVPYQFGASDALFNLGSAVSFVQILPPGVYIAMNGNIFDWNNVKKNVELGRFEKLR